MPENKGTTGASSALFKAAVRAILQPQENSCRTLVNISNKKESVDETADMLQPLKRNVLSKNALRLDASSTMKNRKSSEVLTPASSPQCISKVSSPHASDRDSACYSSTTSLNWSASSSTGMSENSSAYRTASSSFAHPEFQNFLKFKEPEKTSPYANLQFFTPAAKSPAQSCCNQPFTYESTQKRGATVYNALQPTKNLFPMNAEPYFDSHCHLDFLLNKADFYGSFSDYMADNQEEFPPSFDGCIAVFCNPYSFERISCWGKHLQNRKVWASFGCHPKSAASYDDSIEEDLIRALKHPKVRALGEIGLDYSSRSMCSIRQQKEAFRRQLKIAKERNLPVVIHCREAYEDCYDILSEDLPQDYLIHLHCFTDMWNVAEKFLKKFPNLFIGLTNLVTFPSAVEVHEVAKRIPLSRLLLETDAPYFVPTSLSKNVKFSHPGMAIFVAEKIASLKGVDLRDVVIYTRNNAKWVYSV